MRSIGGLVRGLFVVWVLGVVTALIAAFVARGRMSSHGGPKDDDLELVAIFQGVDFASQAPALREVSVTTWFGGANIDLRKAVLDPGGATLTVRAAFGGISLVVPATWPVVVSVTSILAGVGDARDPDLIDPSLPTLTLSGMAVFGGVGIIPAAPSEAMWTSSESEAAEDGSSIPPRDVVLTPA
jgi:hypothetical protein